MREIQQLSSSALVYMADFNTVLAYSEGKKYGFIRRFGFFILEDFADRDYLSKESICVSHLIEEIPSGAFSSKQRALVIPSSVKNISEDAFSECSSLELLSLPGEITGRTDKQIILSLDGKTLKIDIPRSDCSINGKKFGEYSVVSTAITVPETARRIGYYVLKDYSSINVKGVLWAYQHRLIGGEPRCIVTVVLNGLLDSFLVPNSSAIINGRRFSEYSEPPSDVVIPSSVERIGDSAFYNCSALSRVVIPPSVTVIENRAFSFTRLTRVVIPPSVTEIGNNAFRGCSLLSEVELSHGVTRIGSWAFYLCTSLSRVVIPSSVKSIGWSAFCGCSSLSEVVISRGVTEIGWGMFYGCTSLTEIEIPPGVEIIGKEAFRECSSLSRVVIPPSVKKIQEQAFINCYSLSSVVMSPGITEIGWNAFFGCSSLETISIPASVRTIGLWAFCGCSSLTSARVSRDTIVGGNSFPESCKKIIQ